MDIKAEQIKKVYSDTFEDLKRSPLYEIRKIEEWLEIEKELFIEFQRESEIHLKLDNIVRGERLLQFKQNSGKHIYENIKAIAHLKKVEEIQKFQKTNEKMASSPEDIHRFIYLSLRLKILEEWLKRANIRPWIDAKDEITFEVTP